MRFIFQTWEDMTDTIMKVDSEEVSTEVLELSFKAAGRCDVDR